ncbi:hypothetical protein V1387_12805 [Allomuricauda taeanensis]|nr:hypothetical protein [Allomuricauda taeanensis]MEE1963570.1 hypothetical protein [Allomuricauda taeanensis]
MGTERSEVGMQWSEGSDPPGSIKDLERSGKDVDEPWGGTEQ